MALANNNTRAKKKATASEEKPLTNELDFYEGDIQEDLSDECSSDYEILEVEINAKDLGDLIKELKLVNNLETEIICADNTNDDDDVPDEPAETYDDDFDSFQEIKYNYDDQDFNDFSSALEPITEVTDILVTEELPVTEEPITEVKTEVQSVETVKPTYNLKGFKDTATLKLHKLDEFLVHKLRFATKNYLRKRYMNLLMTMQEKIEDAKDLKEPVELDDGKWMCHKCMNVYADKRTLKGHIRVFHNRSRTAKCDQCDYVGATQGKLTFHYQSVHLKLCR